MKKNKSFSSEFFVDVKSSSPDIKTDYEIFENKDKLDEIRSIIIQNIIDNNIPKGYNLNEYINYEIDRYLGSDISNLKRSYVFNLIDNEINGFGPINELLKDKNVTEIMVNAPDEVYVEIDGRIIRDDSVSFIDDNHIIRTIQRIVQPLGRTIDAANPMVDARLKDGSRLNAIIPPLSLKGPVLTIRKFSRNLDNIEDILRKGTMTIHMARFLEAAVKAKLNIIICGGTGTGKTSLLNILSSFIDDNERIITIEDAAELKLKQSHVISLETRLVNYEGSGEVTIRDLVRNSLRMRPDRIIVGEVRGKEAFDMMQAMNTGHEGSLTTLHANSPEDALNRLETMLLMNDMDIPVSAVRGYIENAINLIVNIERLADGRRKVTSICEVVGMKDGNIKLKEIFAFKQKGVTKNNEVIGEFVMYKYTPKVYEKIKRAGITTLVDLFE